MLDLRRKIVESYERGDKFQSSVAESFGVSLSFVEKLLRRRRFSLNSASELYTVLGPPHRR